MKTLLRPPWAAPLAVCLLLAAVHTWPLAAAPHVHSRHDNGDVLLNEWILAWVQHALPRDPLRLFQGNIFHPAPDTLAYSEPLIAPALLGAPVRWLGGSPVLVHNVLILLGLALTAFAGYTVTYRWTQDRWASLLAGSALAFNTHMLVRLAHLQALHAYGLPLALLAADRLLVERRTRDALWLALWLTVLAATSGHFAVFGAVMIGVALAARAADWWRAPLPVLGRFALAAAVTAAAVTPLYLPYQRVAREQGLVRALADVTEYSASLRGYLASAGRVHYETWGGNLFRSEVAGYFPGVAVLALALAALVLTARRSGGTLAAALTGRRVVMLAAIAAAGVVLSLGTHTPLYGWLYAVFPPLRAIRAANRFGYLFLLATGLLAGVGLARLRAAGAFGRHGTAAAVALVAVVNVEALRAPYHFFPFDGIPHIYTLLAAERGPVVLAEQPFYPPHAIFANAEYVLNSTAHFRPLMNGYSGHLPRGYAEYAAAFAPFPDAPAIDAMRRAGVTHVMVHPQRFRERAREVLRAVEASPFLERIAVGRHGMGLYRVK